MVRVQNLLDKQWTLKQISTLLNVHPQTLANHMGRAGIQKRHHLDQRLLLELMDLVCDICGRGRASGHRFVRAQLANQIGCRPTFDAILSAMREFDPVALEARQERLIRRRPYDVTTAMSLMHIDTYDKLRLYGFYIHGAIDGGTKMMMSTTVSMNKSTDSISFNFHAAVHRYGFPMRVRADMAFEARGVGADMLRARGEGAYLVGPSTANQPIENYWNQMYRHVAHFYRNLFATMELHGILDRFSPSDLFSLGVAFMSELQDCVTTLGNTWNHHTVRPQASRGIRSFVPVNRFEASYSEFLRDGHVTRNGVRTISPDVLWPDGAAPVPDGEITSGGVREYPGRRGGPTVEDCLRLHADRLLRDELCCEYPVTKSEERYLVHRQVSLEIYNLRAYLEDRAAGGLAAFMASDHTPHVPTSLVDNIRGRLQALVLPG